MSSETPTPPGPSRWSSVPFEELLACPLRNGLMKPKRMRGHGTPMVNMGEIFTHDRIAAPPMDRVPMDQRERERYLLEDHDLLFARQSLKLSGAGKCSLVLPADEPRTWESHLIRARLDEERADPRFFYYYFRSPQGRENMASIVEQVAAAGIRGSDLMKLRVPCPPLVVQARVAEVLGALDDKIELNQRLSCTLEEAARAVFRGWFVDLSASDAPTAGELVPLERIAVHRRDTVDPQGLPADTPYIGLEHMPRGSIALNQWGQSAQVTSTKARFDAGDILFGRLRPYFKKVGVAFVNGVCSTDVAVIQPIAPAWRTFLLFHLASRECIDFAAAVASGTRMPRVKWQDLARYEVPMPLVEDARRFDRLIEPTLQELRRLTMESHMIAELRDTLLPKLASGELRVAEAEKLVEDVA